MVVMKLNPIASPSSASVPGSIIQKGQKRRAKRTKKTEIARDDGDSLLRDTLSFCTTRRGRLPIPPRDTFCFSAFTYVALSIVEIAYFTLSFFL